MKNYIIPIFIPHLGCKNECIFCNQRKISGSLKPVETSDIKNRIDEYLQYYNKEEEKNIEVAFFGGSFTGIEIEKQIEYLEAVQPYIKEKKIDSIRCSTRPDYIDEEILTMLKKYNVKTIELGVQSLDKEVLKIAKRGHTVEDVERASKLINEFGFVLGHQIMIGLPNSNLKKEIETAKKSIKMGPKIVRLYPVLVINNTKLNDMYQSKEYMPLSLDNAVTNTKELFKLYTENNVNVIRVGLHVTEELQDESSYVAGPIHPAFGQMVTSRIIRDKFVDKIKDIDEKIITVEANEKTINNLIGVKKENLKFIKKNYDKELKFKINNNINNDSIKLR